MIQRYMLCNIHARHCTNILYAIPETPTYVSDPIKTYAIGDTVNFEWTSSNYPTGSVEVKLLEGSSTLYVLMYL